MRNHLVPQGKLPPHYQSGIIFTGILAKISYLLRSQAEISRIFILLVGRFGYVDTHGAAIGPIRIRFTLHARLRRQHYKACPSTMPSLIALTTAWVRSDAPSLRNTAVTCDLTVVSLR